MRQGDYAGAIGTTRVDAICTPVDGVQPFTIHTNDGGAHRRRDRPHGGMYVRPAATALTVGSTDQTLVTHAPPLAFTPAQYQRGGTVGALHPAMHALRASPCGDATPHVVALAFTPAYLSRDQAGGSLDTVVGLLRASDAKNGDATPHVLAFAQNERAEVRDLGDCTGALAAQPGAQQQTYVAIPLKGDGRPPVPARMLVRRLTPLECERLQGFPDGHTAIPCDPAAAARAVRALRTRLAARGIVLTEDDLRLMTQDGPRYRSLGNSMAVPCMAWIGQQIDDTAADTPPEPIHHHPASAIWGWRTPHTQEE